MGNHSHSHTAIPIPMIHSASLPFPCESDGTRGISVVTIPMHISSSRLLSGVRREDGVYTKTRP